MTQAPDATGIMIEVDGAHLVSALVQIPERAVAGLVLAHGAGAGMTHSFMRAAADGLFERGVATLRYQFPYMEAGSKRPDRPQLAQATVRAAVAEAARRMPDVPLFAGGKSFGGRMTSQPQADTPLPSVRGLVFFGFPLHPAKKPSADRAEHLAKVQIPMLFLQGTRDALADMALMAAVVVALRERATLSAIEAADHSFHVPARSGQTDAQVMASMLDTAAAWMNAVMSEPSHPPPFGPSPRVARTPARP